MVAAWKGELECLQLMIEAKADINYQPPEGVSDALSLAVRHRNIDCLCVLLDHPSDAPTSRSSHAKAVALRHAFQPRDLFPAQTQMVAFAMLVSGANFKHAIKARVPKVFMQSATSRYRNVLGFIDAWHGVAVPVLSDLVEVDTRVGRGDYGLYQEPLERVMQYLGLSMTVNQVVNTNVDGKSTRRALIPMQARGANQWHTLYKRTHCASCSARPAMLKKCTCDTARYCNSSCQRKHWQIHRPNHKRVIKEQEEERKRKEKEGAY
jgi:hypothetical protein